MNITTLSSCLVSVDRCGAKGALDHRHILRASCMLLTCVLSMLYVLCLLEWGRFGGHDGLNGLIWLLTAWF